MSIDEWESLPWNICRMYMEELGNHLQRQAGNSAGGPGPATVEPDGDITDLVRPEKIDVKAS